MHATYSCCTFIMFIERMSLLILFFCNISLSGSNLGNNFSGCLGRGFWGPGMARTFIVSHCGFVAMMPTKVKLNRGDGIEYKVI